MPTFLSLSYSSTYTRNIVMYLLIQEVGLFSGGM